MSLEKWEKGKAFIVIEYSSPKYDQKPPFCTRSCSSPARKEGLAGKDSAHAEYFERNRNISIVSGLIVAAKVHW